MKLIQPFPGWRPRPGLAKKVAAPPYDVLTSAEARQAVVGNPDSFLLVSKAEISLENGISPDDNRVYQAAASRLGKMRQKGVLVQDPRPCLYIYRLCMDGRNQTGVVAAASVDAYFANRIKKHEYTRPDKETDRTRHAEALSAHTGPVFLTYRQTTPIDTLVARCIEASPPKEDFTCNDGVRHTLWMVNNPDPIAALVLAFEALPALYIADGHHRTAAAGRICQTRRGAGLENSAGPSGRFLSVLFPDNQVKILDYNRVVRDLNGLSVADFLEQVGQRFSLLPADKPVRPAKHHEFGLYVAGVWYRLLLDSAKVDKADPVGRLDVALLNAHLLDPLLGITDPRRDPRIDFVGGIRGLSGLSSRVDSGEMAVAFSLFPTTLQELMDVADAGQVMPPKSTWFEPKLRDGLVVQAI